MYAWILRPLICQLCSIVKYSRHLADTYSISLQLSYSVNSLLSYFHDHMYTSA